VASRSQDLREALPWVVSLLLHGALASLLLVLPSWRKPEPTLPPVELIDRRPPPPEDKPKPEPEEKPEPQPAAEPAPLAMTRKLPPRTRPPSEAEPSKEPPSKEPVPEDTGPKVFGDRLEGGVTAPTGTGVPIPQGDSMRVSPKIVKRGKAPEKKSTGFKTDYAVGEEAPVAVITAYPKVLKKVDPDYPDRMKELGIEGKVVIELTVASSGKVKLAKLVKSLHAELDKLALAAAQQMLFSPALVGKTPVQVKIPYTFTFVLD
jgi:periplasmic protein TonB